MKANENILDFDELYADVQLVNRNLFIENSDKALELVTRILNKKKIKGKEERDTINDMIDKIFSESGCFSLDNELEYYQRFQKLCGRLSEQAKLSKLEHKTVISLGGKFSSGKSMFINSISGINDLLPESQNPTTSIPSYITYDELPKVTANSFYGDSIELDEDSLRALTHEFYNTYGIGFSGFIESISIGSPDYELPKNIALLDTPGYTKFDVNESVKSDLSDRTRAFNQLKITDYLIWLIDIHNGEITADDIDFIDKLGIDTPILIVFNKADIKTEKDIKLILEKANQIVERDLVTKCFGITAYSSYEVKEYGNDLIRQFMQYAENSHQHSNDILEDFYALEADMRASICDAIDKNAGVSDYIMQFIENTNKVLELRSLTELWSDKAKMEFGLRNFLEKYDQLCDNINSMVKKIMGKNQDEI